MYFFHLFLNFSLFLFIKVHPRQGSRVTKEFLLNETCDMNVRRGKRKKDFEDKENR